MDGKRLLKVIQKVKVVGGRLPKNWRYAGMSYVFDMSTKPKKQCAKLWNRLKNKYPNGVRFTEAGFPDFSPYKHKKVREIKFKAGELTGYYHDDKNMAEAILRKEGKPTEMISDYDDYVWHHHEDGQTLILVPKELHNNIAHTGGAAIIRAERDAQAAGAMAVVGVSCKSVIKELVAPHSSEVSDRMDNGEEVSEDEVVRAALLDAQENFEPVPTEWLHDTGKQVIKSGVKEAGEVLKTTEVGSAAEGVVDTVEEGTKGWVDAVIDPHSNLRMQREMLKKE
ncbi:MAG: HNH endonuclease [Planctomycetota bacterium]|nr:HNH endonuclease [Planctomycetota bacterium]